jgi:aryl-alcohol dehydrogenase-like predicted oxidoreductase
VIPYSPVAGGVLSRPLGKTSVRGDTDPILKTIGYTSRESDQEIIKRVEALAIKRGVSMAQIATAWMLSKDGRVHLITWLTE